MSSNLLIWFILFDSDTGQPYKGTTADKVSISSSADVADFRVAVKKKDKDEGDAAILTPFKSSQLLVYKNKYAFDNRNADEGKQEPLEEDSCINNLGTSKKDALIVVVQSSLITSLPTGSLTQNSMVSQPRDKSITDNNLNLLLQNDVIKFLEYKINELAPFNPKKPYHANFLDNCLEYRLDRRHTSYTLDDINNIKLLVAVSGSGKTRQLLELLYSQPGYYFVVSLQDDDFGSDDLHFCKRFSVLHPSRVKFFIKLLFFVRGYVCSYLYDLGYITAPMILVAQLHPKSFFGCDLFADLYDSLVRHTDIVLTYGKVKHWFHFVAIDEIQASLEGERVFNSSKIEINRPFFSPLVYYSKIIGGFTTFVIAGTGINFLYLKELLNSISNKDVVFVYAVISGLKPLDTTKAESYIRQIMSDHHFNTDQIKEVVKLVSPNPLFHGRARFIASVLDPILKGKTVDFAIQKFIKSMSRPNSVLFLLKFYRDDLQLERNSFNVVVGTNTFGGKTFGEIVRQALIGYLMKGTFQLLVNDQDASDMVQYGIGFCNIDDEGMILSVQLEELAIIECLRYLIPVSSLVPDICCQLLSCPKPQMLGYILEYLVGYALVAGLNQDNANLLKSTHGDFEKYLISNDETEILFPDHLCGPDIVYKYKGTVYIVQVKFVNKITKQERLNASHTTDPKRFYWNKNRDSVLAGFEGKQQTICHKLEPFNIQRLVFLHTTTKTTDGMDDVEVINQKLRPYFFDQVHKDMWALLNKLRYNFKQ